MGTILEKAGFYFVVFSLLYKPKRPHTVISRPSLEQM